MSAQTLVRPDVRVPFAALVLAMLPAVLDQTILGTALPTIAADLGHLSDLSWVVTAYVVAATATTPLWGKLADRQGPKRLLLVSLSLFLAASALCGTASSIGGLIAFRAIQGVGAGGLMTLAYVAVGLLVEPRERGRYQGYITAVFAAASVAGPLLGGVLVDAVDWRAVFYVNVPVGLLAIAGLTTALPSGTPDRPAAPLDLAGAALIAAASGLLLLGCVDGSVWLFAGALAAAAALVARERRAADPIVPLPMLRTPVVAVASATLFLTTAGLFAVVVFVPVFLQAGAGVSATEAGLLLAPMMAGTVVATTLIGRAMQRTGRYRQFPILGLAGMTVGLSLLAATAQVHSVVIAGVALAIFGLGFGGVTQVLMVAVQTSVERRTIGAATAVTTFSRALGGAISAAVLGLVFDARVDAGVITAAQTVFAAAIPLTALALLVATRLPHRELARTSTV